MESNNRMQKVKPVNPSEAAPRPRVPIPDTIDLIGEQRTIQVNHCRMPDCKNFGIPARHQHGKREPSDDRDMHYKVHSTSKGTVPSVRCKSCNDKPADEIKHLHCGGVQTSRGPECDSGRWRKPFLVGTLSASTRDRPIAHYPLSYHKRGTGPGGGQYYGCKACRKTVLVSDPVRLRQKHRAIAADVFGRIVNKAPVRRTVAGARLKSTRSYYSILNFIHSRCRAHSGAFDRALMDGRLQLPR